MKKVLLASMAAMCLGANANAQLALENFNTGVLPAGWTLINDGHTVSTSFTGITTLPAALTAAAWVPIHAAGATGDYQMITTSLFTPAAAANRWLITPAFAVTSPNTVIQWDDYNLNSDENIQIKVSPSAGTTAASFTATIYSAPAADGSLTTHQVPIGAYNGTTITIAFRDTTTNVWGLLVDNVKTTILPSLDLGVLSANIAPFIATGVSQPISGQLRNYGITTVTSLNINYSINGGTPVTTPISSVSIPLGGTYTYTSGTPWVPATGGSYNVKIWADNINGGMDGNHTNDTISGTVIVVDSLQPKMVMIEEFTQASCDPCANAHINVDTVFGNNLSRSAMVRYHVNFPGRDCMDSVTLAPFVSARLSYYSVSGVPDAQVDGSYVYPGAGGLSSAVIASAASVGSPLKITVTPSYNWSTQTYSYSAAIKSYGPLAAGLKAYAVLVEDTLTYAANQSTESIPQTVFPQVAENMFPSSAGTALAAFTTGSTQTITASWVKNHAWGSDRTHWAYDSSLTGKIIVFVEDDSRKYVYQAGQASVATGHVHGVGVGAVTGNTGSMNVFPNPASKTATVALNLTANAAVSMEVYNTLGQVVYSMPAEQRNAGTSVSTIDVSNFANGEYFVKIAIGTEVLNQTLTIMK